MIGRLRGILLTWARRLRLARSGTRLVSGLSAFALIMLLAASHTPGVSPAPRAGAGSPSDSLQGLPARPKLLIVIIIDQFRAEYLFRFRPHFVSGGFNLLLSGAHFAACRYEQAMTVTAPGHATLLTGAYPDAHGIIGNEWFDRELNRLVNCVEDPETRLVDDHGITSIPGRSPHYLVGTTLGDELRAATDFRSRVVSISLKDRGAVLPGGHTANAAYWYDAPTEQFISSTYYMTALPQWAVDFNSRQPAKAYCGKPWQSVLSGSSGESNVIKRNPSAPDEPCPNARFLAWLNGTPYMSEIELHYAEEAIRGEKLGQGESTDLLTVSLSANDYIGHQFGPYSPELQDVTLRTDRYLADFFKFVDSTVGLDNVWIALSADHGVAPNPKFILEHRLGPGHASLSAVAGKANGVLSEKYGDDEYIKSAVELGIYLNQEALRKHRIPEDQAEDIVAEAVRTVPGVEIALTRHQLMEGTMPVDHLAPGVAKSFYSRRSGDVFTVLDPFAVPVQGDTETSHGTPWNYDSQVPLLLWGSPFRPGFYVTTCHPIDLAATLAVVLGLNQPSGAAGRPLREALK